MTFYEAASKARAALVNAGLQPRTAALDAELLARHAAGWDLATWLARRSEAANEPFTTRYAELIARRLTREPVAYIRGVQEFWGRDFRVTPAALIPRSETELLIEHANVFLSERPAAVVADIGTGCGCIAVTLALEHPAATVYATDVSEPALALARENAATYGPPERLHFIHGSCLAGVPRPIDLIATNPPYIARRDEPGLGPEVREHEPSVALFGGQDGWQIIRQILAEAATALAPDGCMLMELGYGQSEEIGAEVAAVPGLVLDDVRADLAGIFRLAIIRPAR